VIFEMPLIEKDHDTLFRQLLNKAHRVIKEVVYGKFMEQMAVKA